MHMVRPRVVISRCLEFDHCRYDGQMITSALVKSLKAYVNAITVCPEVEIGLGVPRRRIRVVSGRDSLRLVQPETGRDLTVEMHRFVQSFLSSLEDTDGFILKSGSPSCGINDVKLYATAEGGGTVGKGSGFLGSEVRRRFPMLALEHEARLTNPRIADDFLIKIFCFARFREVKASGRVRDLVDFHSRNKMLLMSHHKAETVRLGRIVARSGDLDDPFADYEQSLRRALARGMRIPSVVDVLMHSLGRFKRELGGQEKGPLLDMLEDYREGRICIAGPVALIRSWAVRFGDEYLLNQTFLEPYPRGLIGGRLDREYKHIAASGEGLDPDRPI